MAMTRHEIERLQRALNAFTKENKALGYQSLIVDGEMGALTKKRILNIKYQLGYLRANTNVKVDEAFYWRMKHPKQVNVKWNQDKGAVKRGKKRRTKRRAAVRKNKITAFLKPGVTTFDGVPVAKCAVPILQWCREHGWQGKLVSGFRTPAYSEGLCLNMCGHPTCPGRCAGRSTNHSGNSPARFAMDVSDYIKFGEVVAHCPLQPHVHNALPNDRVHFSPTGG